MGRCLSPCLGDLDPNLYRERLDAALRLFEAATAARALLAHVDAPDARGVARRSATSAPPGCGAARGGWSRCSSGSAACCARRTPARGWSLAPHPAERARSDAFWIVGGRVADWGPLPADAEELAARTDVALAAAPRAVSAAGCPPTSSTRLRIIGSWLAGHEDARVLELEPRPDQRALAAFTAGPTADRPRTARRAAPSARARVPVPGS